MRQKKPPVVKKVYVVTLHYRLGTSAYKGRFGVAFNRDDAMEFETLELATESAKKSVRSKKMFGCDAVAVTIRNEWRVA